MPTPRRPYPQHYLCLALLLPAALSEANPLHGSLQTQWHSRYVSEGRDNLDGHSLHSLGGDLTKDHGPWGSGKPGALAAATTGRTTCSRNTRRASAAGNRTST